MLREYQNHEKAIKRLSSKSSFTLSEADKAGLSHPEVLRLVKLGKITRIQRGLYSVSGNEPFGREADYQAADKKFKSKSVVGGLTALSNYNLIQEVPSKIWLLVPEEVRTTDKKYRLLRTKKSLNSEIIKKPTYKIVTVERALIDGLIYKTKIGERIVLTATIKALKEKITTEKKLFEAAKNIAALNILNKHWQVILAGLAT
jgi:predicted transcriptional regulator of viral defense system